jgi:hypothetical protein
MSWGFLLLLVAYQGGVSAAAAGAPTYAKDVSRILQASCERCHRPGQIGPFALTNYEEARAFATEIKRVTEERRMPPWSAVPGHGEFRNERRLSAEEIATIAAWVDAGAPLGNKKDLPAKMVWNDDWSFGPPDLVLTPEGDFEVSGKGIDQYRCFVMPSGLHEVRYIQAMEVKPGNRKVVHHVRAFADITGQAKKLDASDPKPGFDCGLSMIAPYKRISIGGWAPGMVPEKLPETIGVYLPADADIVMEVHYHRNGLKQTDRSSLGIYLHQVAPKNIAKSHVIMNIAIRIPPGVERHEERAKKILNAPILATSIMPHMHLLGVEMRVTATLPDGSVRDLVWAKPYDFNWQTSYRFKEPILLPKDTRIDVVAIYNNSDSNPKNPSNPLKEVRFGEATDQEMLVAFLGYIDPPAATTPVPASSGGAQ